MNETTKQNLAILVITLLLAGAIFIFFNYLNPGIKQYKQLKADTKETQAKIELLKDYQAKAAALAKNYDTEEPNIDKINLSLPSKPNTAQELASLTAIAKNHDLVFNNLSFQEGKDKKSSYLDIKISFTTDYDNFKSWVEDVEKEIRITDIRKVNMKLAPIVLSSKKHHRITDFPLNISITLRSYYLSSANLNQTKNK